MIRALIGNDFACHQLIDGLAENRTKMLFGCDHNQIFRTDQLDGAVDTVDSLDLWRIELRRIEAWQKCRRRIVKTGNAYCFLDGSVRDDIEPIQGGISDMMRSSG